jgi:glycosyltransferase involved in cell wall biosynthesis
VKQPNLSIILPVHNEVDSLGRVLSEWDSSLRTILGLDHVFIICEDGSTDGTKELINHLERQYPILNNSVQPRRGYGQAVRDGLSLATSDYLLCIDSDGQISPDEMPQIWKRRSEERLLMGWRYPRLDPPVRLIYSRLFKIYHMALFSTRLNDPSCPFVFGPKKLFDKVAPLLIYMEEGFWWGFGGACWKLQVPIDEIHIRHRERFAGNTQVYKLSKMPGIIIRNSIGLLKLRFAPINRCAK